MAAKEIKEQVQEGKQRQADLEAVLEQLSTSKAEMSVQMEMMAASQLNLKTKLQEEQEARASISATNLLLEEEKATLARETEEQSRQLSQVCAVM